MALADLVVVMNDGRIEQAAPPREVFKRPATAFVARFMGDHNVIWPRAVGGRQLVARPRPTASASLPPRRRYRPTPTASPRPVHGWSNTRAPHGAS